MFKFAEGHLKHFKGVERNGGMKKKWVDRSEQNLRGVCEEVRKAASCFEREIRVP